jgi:hypothetical protein
MYVRKVVRHRRAARVHRQTVLGLSYVDLACRLELRLRRVRVLRAPVVALGASRRASSRCLTREMSILSFVRPKCRGRGPRRTTSMLVRRGGRDFPACSCAMSDGRVLAPLARATTRLAHSLLAAARPVPGCSARARLSPRQGRAPRLLRRGASASCWLLSVSGRHLRLVVIRSPGK